MQNFFNRPQGRVVGLGVVIIPFDYEELPDDRRKKVVPICIEAHDRDGNVIDPVWFGQGVAPISQELTDLAQSVLGDKRMVSDIAQPSVHKVWNRHRHDTGKEAVCADLAAGSVGSERPGCRRLEGTRSSHPARRG
jgi:hypothetical protein